MEPNKNDMREAVHNLFKPIMAYYEAKKRLRELSVKYSTTSMSSYAHGFLQEIRDFLDKAIEEEANLKDYLSERRKNNLGEAEQYAIIHLEMWVGQYSREGDTIRSGQN